MAKDELEDVGQLTYVAVRDSLIGESDADNYRHTIVRQEFMREFWQDEEVQGLVSRWAKLTGLDLDEKLLVRIKDTAPQVGASRSQRRSNVEGSFRCQGDVTGKPLILVDDVTTTGSTLSACAATLKSSGATTVWGLTLAREA